jgi:hypothetical protein
MRGVVLSPSPTPCSCIDRPACVRLPLLPAARCDPHGNANLLTSAADDTWKAIRKAVAVSFSMQVRSGVGVSADEAVWRSVCLQVGLRGSLHQASHDTWPTTGLHCRAC